TDAVLRLIVNADDFGLTSGVNRGIAEAHAKGIVTSSTLMANGPTFSQAIEIARALPDLAIGCHVTLVDGTPLTGPEKVSSLLSNRRNSGLQDARFRTAFGSFAIASALGKLSAEEIEAEAIAQIRKLQNSAFKSATSILTSTSIYFPKCWRPFCAPPKPAECQRSEIPLARSGYCICARSLLPGSAGRR